MIFLHPFISIIGLIIFVLFLKFKRHKFLGYSNVNLFNFKISWKDKLISKIPKFLFYLVIVGVFLAISQPRISKEIIYEKVTSRDIVYLVDLSWSMEEQEKIELTKGPLIKFMQKKPNDRFGLMVFGDDTYGVWPLSFDHDVIVLKISQLGKEALPFLGGTNIWNALRISLKYIKSDSKAKNPLLIIVSDGEDSSATMGDRLDFLLYLLRKSNTTLYWINIKGEPSKNMYTKTSSLKDLMEAYKKGKIYSIDNVNLIKDVIAEIEKIETDTFEIEIEQKTIELYPSILVILSFLVVLYVYVRGHEL